VKLLDIADVAQRSGMPASTLRFYEATGLTSIRDGLRHAAACSAPSHMECPNFQRFVRLAGAGHLDPTKEKALATIR
jgi:hypothetical protein